MTKRRPVYEIHRQCGAGTIHVATRRGYDAAAVKAHNLSAANPDVCYLIKQRGGEWEGAKITPNADD